MKIDNIPLKDHEAFTKPLKGAHLVRRVHSEPLQGSKSVRLSKEQREALKERRESLRELSQISHKKPLVNPRVDPRIKVDVIPKLCKRGLMQYINQHSLEHLNPSECKKMDKRDLIEIAKSVEHIK